MSDFMKHTHLVFAQTLRLLMAGKETVLLLAFGLVLLLSMLFGMDDVKEEKSRIVVGIADEDISAFSAQVLSRMKQLEGYEIVEGTSVELLDLLRKGEVSAVGVIREGYQENVLNGDTDDLVLLYETGAGNPLLTDVLAGTMIQEICSGKGYQLFQKYMEEKNGEELETEEEYRAFAESYFADDTFDFSFEITYVSEEGTQSRAPENEVIYVQAILAIAAMMMGFLALYATMPYHDVCHGRVARKVGTLPIGKVPMVLGSGFAVLVLSGGFAAAFLLTFTIRNQRNFSDYLAFLVCTLVYLCVIVSIMLLCATVISARQIYQMGMTALLLVFGVFGLISIVDGLLLPEGVSTWIPNGGYVRKMMELYQN